MNLDVDSPLGCIVKEFASWKGAEETATGEGRAEHADRCRTVANRLAWALGVLGVDVAEENEVNFGVSTELASKVAEKAASDDFCAKLAASIADEIRAGLTTRDAATTAREDAIHADGYVKGLREALRLLRGEEKGASE